MQLAILIMVSLLTLINLPFGIMTYVGLYNKYKTLMKGGKHK